MVIKKDGTRQPYDRDKLRKGILRACVKRNISMDQIESLLDSIEGKINNSLEREVTSEFIGELVMDKLRKLDEVAYVRFASVYRHFKDINTFMNELSKLLSDK
jgi:transcriptional repressor NrdR